MVVSNGARRPHFTIHFRAWGVVGAVMLNLGPPHCGFIDIFSLGFGFAATFTFFDWEESSALVDNSRDLLGFVVQMHLGRQEWA
jgi:hypothetical protein